jgi:hypothetical protein
MIIQRSQPRVLLPVLMIALVVIVGGYLVVKPSLAAGPIGDLNNDGTVNIFDLSILLSHWGESSTPTPTPTNTPSPTPTASASSSPGSCVYSTSATNGQHDFAAVPYITGAASAPWVGPNVWNGGGYQQTLCANSPKDWYITANANTNFGGVLTYPNTGFYMSGTVDGKSSISSSWGVTIPTNAQTAGWAAYDLWFNNWADEVFIATDINANSNYNCTGVATITVSGIPWHMCDFGSERVWKPGTDDQHLVNRTSGSIDVKAFLTWMEQNGKLPTGSTWTAGSFGFEVCDTGGTTQTFRVNDFSWVSN